MIGERLYELRKDAGLTQDELGAILKVNKHSISSYERDKSEPPDAIKILIANYFSVSTDYLLGITDNPAPGTREHNLLRLPSGFPSEALDELREFIAYLIYRHKKT